MEVVFLLCAHFFLSFFISLLYFLFLLFTFASLSLLSFRITSIYCCLFVLSGLAGGYGVSLLFIFSSFCCIGTFSTIFFAFSMAFSSSLSHARHDGFAEDPVFPSFDFSVVELDLFGEEVLSLDCQSGIMAVLSTSGVLIVYDRADANELMRGIIKNPFKVFVHASGAFVLVSSLDGEVSLYSTFERQLLCAFPLQLRGVARTSALPSGAAAASPLVAECVTWVPPESVDGHSTQQSVRSWESMSCVVGVASGDMLLLVSFKGSGRSAKGECQLLAYLPTSSGTTNGPVRSVVLKCAGPLIVLAASTATRLYRAHSHCPSSSAGGAEMRSFLAAVAAGEIVLTVREVPLSVWDGEGPAAAGALSVFMSSLQSPLHAYCWASAGGLVHGLFPVPHGTGTAGAAPLCSKEKEQLSVVSTSQKETGSALWEGEHHLSLTQLQQGSAVEGGGAAAATVATLENLFPRQTPVQVLLTAFHMVLIYPHRCIVLGHPAGLAWRGVSSTARGDRVGLSEVLERVRFDPFKDASVVSGGSGAASKEGLCLRGGVRDVATRLMYVYSGTRVWALAMDREHHRQWPLFIDRALNPAETPLMRARLFDAAACLASQGTPARARTELLRGLFYLRMGAIQCATSLLAACENFEEAYSATHDSLSRGQCPATTLTSNDVLVILLEKRYRRLLPILPAASSSLPLPQKSLAATARASPRRSRHHQHQREELACLVGMIVVRVLQSVTETERMNKNPREASSGERRQVAVAQATHKLDAFLVAAATECAELFAEPAFFSTIACLLEDQGRQDSLRRLAEAVGHARYVLALHIAAAEYVRAAEELARFCVSGPSSRMALYYTFTPLLIERAPVALLTGLAKVLRRDVQRAEENSSTSGRALAIDVEQLMPSLVRYTVSMNEPGAHAQEHQVVRLLEVVTLHYGCTSAAVHNYLVALLAEQRDTGRLSRVLRESVYYDVDVALRACLSSGCVGACVLLYKRLHFFEEAVRTVLEYSTDSGKASVAAAQDILREVPPAELSPGTLHRLWAYVARHAAAANACSASATGDAHARTAAVLEVVEASQGVLQLEDVLGFLRSDAAVWELKDAVCATLNARTEEIRALHGRQAASAQTAERVKADMHHLRHQYGHVTARQRCLLCHRGLLQSAEPYLVYPLCQHVVHEACALARLRSMGGLEAFITDEGIPAHVLEGVRVVEDLAQRDCVVCGEAAVVELDIPIFEEDPSWTAVDM